MLKSSKGIYLFRRAIALLVLVTFVPANHFFIPSAAAQQSSTRNPKKLPLNFASVQVPAGIGKIQKIYQGKSRDVVVLVQDAHAIPDAQRNIEKIIEHFQKQYGVNLIGIEGAAAELDPQLFQSFPDKEILRKTFDRYFDKGELTGSTAAALFSPDEGSVFHGVEDWPLYEEGLGIYLKAMEKAPRIAAELTTLKENLHKQKQAVYSGKLLQVDQLLTDFQANHASLPEILKKLAAFQAPAKGSEIALLLEETAKEGNQASLEVEVRNIAIEIKTLLDAKSGADRKAFNTHFQEFQTSRLSPGAFALWLKELLEKNEGGLSGAPSFSHRLAQIIKNQKRLRDIEGTQFFEDFEQYTQSVKQPLFRNDAERALDKKSRELDLLEKLTKLELSREEWEEIACHSRTGLGGNPQVCGSPTETFGDDIKPHLAFYENAKKRDRAFLKNLTVLMKERRTNSSLLVAGGFHTPGLIQQMEESGISYVLLTPEIKSLPENNAYREHMSGDVSWKHYFKVKNGKVNLYEAFVRAARDQLLGSPEAINGEPVLKAWRDQIILDLVKKEQIAKAGEYTAFLDEVNLHAGMNAREDSQPEWQARLSTFVQALRKLDSNGQLTEPNILKLLTPAAFQAYAPAGALVPGAEIDVRDVLSISRAEVRTQMPRKPFIANAVQGLPVSEKADSLNKLKYQTAVDQKNKTFSSMRSAGIREKGTLLVLVALTTAAVAPALWLLAAMLFPSMAVPAVISSGFYYLAMASASVVSAGFYAVFRRKYLHAKQEFSNASETLFQFRRQLLAWWNAKAKASHLQKDAAGGILQYGLRKKQIRERIQSLLLLAPQGAELQRRVETIMGLLEELILDGVEFLRTRKAAPEGVRSIMRAWDDDFPAIVNPFLKEFTSQIEDRSEVRENGEEEERMTAAEAGTFLEEDGDPIETRNLNETERKWTFRALREEERFGDSIQPAIVALIGDLAMSDLLKSGSINLLRDGGSRRLDIREGNVALVRIRKDDKLLVSLRLPPESGTPPHLQEGRIDDYAGHSRFMKQIEESIHWGKLKEIQVNGETFEVNSRSRLQTYEVVRKITQTIFSNQVWDKPKYIFRSSNEGTVLEIQSLRLIRLDGDEKNHRWWNYTIDHEFSPASLANALKVLEPTYQVTFLTAREKDSKRSKNLDLANKDVRVPAGTLLTASFIPDFKSRSEMRGALTEEQAIARVSSMLEDLTARASAPASEVWIYFEEFRGRSKNPTFLLKRLKADKGQLFDMSGILPDQPISLEIARELVLNQLEKQRYWKLGGGQYEVSLFEEEPGLYLGISISRIMTNLSRPVQADGAGRAFNFTVKQSIKGGRAIRKAAAQKLGLEPSAITAILVRTAEGKKYNNLIDSDSVHYGDSLTVSLNVIARSFLRSEARAQALQNLITDVSQEYKAASKENPGLANLLFAYYLSKVNYRENPPATTVWGIEIPFWPQDQDEVIAKTLKALQTEDQRLLTAAGIEEYEKLRLRNWGPLQESIIRFRMPVLRDLQKRSETNGLAFLLENFEARSEARAQTPNDQVIDAVINWAKKGDVSLPGMSRETAIQLIDLSSRQRTLVQLINPKGGALNKKQEKRRQALTIQLNQVIEEAGKLPAPPLPGTGIQTSTTGPGPARKLSSLSRRQVLGGILAAGGLGIVSFLVYYFVWRKDVNAPLEFDYGPGLQFRVKNDFQSIRQALLTVLQWAKDKNYPRQEELNDYIQAMRNAQEMDPPVPGIPFRKQKNADGAVVILINTADVYDMFRGYHTAGSKDFFLEALFPALAGEARGWARLNQADNAQQETMRAATALLTEERQLLGDFSAFRNPQTAVAQRENLKTLLANQTENILQTVSYFAAVEGEELLIRYRTLEWLQALGEYSPERAREVNRLIAGLDRANPLREKMEIERRDAEHIRETQGDLNRVLAYIVYVHVPRSLADFQLMIHNGPPQQRNAGSAGFLYYTFLERQRYLETNRREGFDVERFVNARDLVEFRPEEMRSSAERILERVQRLVDPALLPRSEMRRTLTKEMAEKFAEEVRYTAALGKPGSGKGTILKQFVPELNRHLATDKQYAILTVGDVFRAISEKSKAAKENRTPDPAKIGIFRDLEVPETVIRALAAMKKGKMIPDEIALQVLRKVLDMAPYKNAYGIFFDGFPRTAGQLEALNLKEIRLGGSALKINFNFILDIEDQTVRGRAANRRAEEDDRAAKANRLPDYRVDDKPETVEDRIVEYEAVTKEAVNAKRGSSDTIELKAERPGMSAEESTRSVYEDFLRRLEIWLSGVNRLDGDERNGLWRNYSLLQDFKAAEFLKTIEALEPDYQVIALSVYKIDSDTKTETLNLKDGTRKIKEGALVTASFRRRSETRAAEEGWDEIPLNEPLSLGSRLTLADDFKIKIVKIDHSPEHQKDFVRLLFTHPSGKYWISKADLYEAKPVRNVLEGRESHRSHTFGLALNTGDTVYVGTKRDKEADEADVLFKINIGPIDNGTAKTAGLGIRVRKNTPYILPKSEMREEVKLDNPFKQAVWLSGELGHKKLLESMSEDMFYVLRTPYEPLFIRRKGNELFSIADQLFSAKPGDLFFLAADGALEYVAASGFPANYRQDMEKRKAQIPEKKEGDFPLSQSELAELKKNTNDALTKAALTPEAVRFDVQIGEPAVSSTNKAITGLLVSYQGIQGFIPRSRLKNQPDKYRRSETVTVYLQSYQNGRLVFVETISVASKKAAAPIKPAAPAPVSSGLFGANSLEELKRKLEEKGQRNRSETRMSEGEAKKLLSQFQTGQSIMIQGQEYEVSIFSLARAARFAQIFEALLVLTKVDDDFDWRKRAAHLRFRDHFESKENSYKTTIPILDPFEPATAAINFEAGSRFYVALSKSSVDEAGWKTVARQFGVSATAGANPADPNNPEFIVIEGPSKDNADKAAAEISARFPMYQISPAANEIKREGSAGVPPSYRVILQKNAFDSGANNSKRSEIRSVVPIQEFLGKLWEDRDFLMSDEMIAAVKLYFQGEEPLPGRESLLESYLQESQSSLTVEDVREYVRETILPQYFATFPPEGADYQFYAKDTEAFRIADYLERPSAAVYLKIIPVPEKKDFLLHLATYQTPAAGVYLPWSSVKEKVTPLLSLLQQNPHLSMRDQNPDYLRLWITIAAAFLLAIFVGGFIVPPLLALEAGVKQGGYFLGFSAGAGLIWFLIDRSLAQHRDIKIKLSSYSVRQHIEEELNRLASHAEYAAAGKVIGESLPTPMAEEQSEARPDDESAPGSTQIRPAKSEVRVYMPGYEPALREAQEIALLLRKRSHKTKEEWIRVLQYFVAKIPSPKSPSITNVVAASNGQLKYSQIRNALLEKVSYEEAGMVRDKRGRKVDPQAHKPPKVPAIQKKRLLRMREEDSDLLERWLKGTHKADLPENGLFAYAKPTFVNNPGDGGGRTYLLTALPQISQLERTYFGRNLGITKIFELIEPPQGGEWTADNLPLFLLRYYETPLRSKQIQIYQLPAEFRENQPDVPSELFVPVARYPAALLGEVLIRLPEDIRRSTNHHLKLVTPLELFLVEALESSKRANPLNLPGKFIFDVRREGLEPLWRAFDAARIEPVNGLKRKITETQESQDWPLLVLDRMVRTDSYGHRHFLIRGTFAKPIPDLAGHQESPLAFVILFETNHEQRDPLGVSKAFAYWPTIGLWALGVIDAEDIAASERTYALRKSYVTSNFLSSQAGENVFESADAQQPRWRWMGDLPVRYFNSSVKLPGFKLPGIFKSSVNVAEAPKENPQTTRWPLVFIENGRDKQIGIKRPRATPPAPEVLITVSRENKILPHNRDLVSHNWLVRQLRISRTAAENYFKDGTIQGRKKPWMSVMVRRSALPNSEAKDLWEWHWYKGKKVTVNGGIPKASISPKIYEKGKAMILLSLPLESVRAKMKTPFLRSVDPETGAITYAYYRGDQLVLTMNEFPSEIADESELAVDALTALNFSEAEARAIVPKLYTVPLPLIQPFLSEAYQITQAVKLMPAQLSLIPAEERQTVPTGPLALIPLQPWMNTPEKKGVIASPVGIRLLPSPRFDILSSIAEVDVLETTRSEARAASQPMAATLGLGSPAKSEARTGHLFPATGIEGIVPDHQRVTLKQIKADSQGLKDLKKWLLESSSLRKQATSFGFMPGDDLDDSAAWEKIELLQVIANKYPDFSDLWEKSVPNIIKRLQSQIEKASAEIKGFNVVKAQYSRTGEITHKQEDYQGLFFVPVFLDEGENEVPVPLKTPPPAAKSQKSRSEARAASQRTAPKLGQVISATEAWFKKHLDDFPSIYAVGEYLVLDQRNVTRNEPSEIKFIPTEFKGGSKKVKIEIKKMDRLRTPMRMLRSKEGVYLVITVSYDPTISPKELIEALSVKLSGEMHKSGRKEAGEIKKEIEGIVRQAKSEARTAPEVREAAVTIIEAFKENRKRPDISFYRRAVKTIADVKLDRFLPELYAAEAETIQKDNAKQVADTGAYIASFGTIKQPVVIDYIISQEDLARMGKNAVPVIANLMQAAHDDAAANVQFITRVTVPAEVQHYLKVRDHNLRDGVEFKKLGNTITFYNPKLPGYEARLQDHPAMTVTDSPNVKGPVLLSDAFGDKQEVVYEGTEGVQAASRMLAAARVQVAQSLSQKSFNALVQAENRAEAYRVANQNALNAMGSVVRIMARMRAALRLEQAA